MGPWAGFIVERSAAGRVVALFGAIGLLAEEGADDSGAGGLLIGKLKMAWLAVPMLFVVK